MRILKSSFFIFYLYTTLPALAQITDERLTTQANIQMTINNLGLIGNAFRGSYTQKNYPSCEYPAGSSIEHMFQGGLWVGGFKKGLGPYVSTAAFDAAAGYSSGRSNFEFTSLSPTISERSSLTQSQLYSVDAVSHQDFITSFTDKNFSIPGTNPPTLIDGHVNPLGLDVRQESYNWNYPFANFFVILNYQITNTDSVAIDSVHVGQYYNAVVRNVSRTQPSGTAFFNKGGNGFVDSLNMGYVFDAKGDVGYTESYVGVKFLGAEKLGTNGCSQQVYIPGKSESDRFKVNFQTWLFGSSDPKFFPPNTEPERFARMRTGLQYEENWATATPPGEPIRETIRKAGNRTNVLSCGSLGRLEPGETFSVVFAVVCAKKDNSEQLANEVDSDIQKRNLIANGLWSQTAYNGEDANGNGILEPTEDLNNNGCIDRYILPSPPDVPKTRVVSRNQAVDIYWTADAENSVDPISKEKDFEGYKVYKSSFAFDIQPTIDLQNSFELYGEWDKEGNEVAYNTGFSKIKLQNDTIFPDDSSAVYAYKCTIPNLQNGWQHVVAVTAFDRGSAKNNLGPLETAPRANQFLVFPGTAVNENPDKLDPFVYPDPYYGGAAWQGSSTRPEDGKLYFANLPALCEIRIFTTAGDLVDVFTHNATTYNGDIGWYKTYSTFSQDENQPDRRIMAGGEHAWSLLSRDSQIISRGLYLFSVKDLKTEKFYTGKFTIIK